MAKNEKNKGLGAPDDETTGGAPVSGAPDPADPVEGQKKKLRYRAIEFKYQGRMIRVDQATLDADPELYAFMATKHPEELV